MAIAWFRMFCLLAGLFSGMAAGVSFSSAGQTSLVKIDGSSTVFPITEAVAEEFQKETRGSVRVTVGISGTGGLNKRNSVFFPL